MGCIFVSLDTLERLVDPEVKPGSADYKSFAMRQKPPFFQVANLSAAHQMNHITLFELDNEPYLAVVQPPGVIALTDLTRRSVCVLGCLDHHHYRGQVRKLVLL